MHWESFGINYLCYSVCIQLPHQDMNLLSTLDMIFKLFINRWGTYERGLMWNKDSGGRRT